MVCRIRYRVSFGDIPMKCLSHQVSSLCESKFNQYVKPSDHRANGACEWIMQCVMSWQATHQTYTRVRTSQEAYLQRMRVSERGNKHAETGDRQWKRYNEWKRKRVSKRERDRGKCEIKLLIRATQNQRMEWNARACGVIDRHQVSLWSCQFWVLQLSLQGYANARCD